MHKTVKLILLLLFLLIQLKDAKVESFSVDGITEQTVDSIIDGVNTTLQLYPNGNYVSALMNMTDKMLKLFNFVTSYKNDTTVLQSFIKMLNLLVDIPEEIVANSYNNLINNTLSNSIPVFISDTTSYLHELNGTFTSNGLDNIKFQFVSSASNLPLTLLLKNKTLTTVMPPINNLQSYLPNSEVLIYPDTGNPANAQQYSYSIYKSKFHEAVLQNTSFYILLIQTTIPTTTTTTTPNTTTTTTTLNITTTTVTTSPVPAQTTSTPTQNINCPEVVISNYVISVYSGINVTHVIRFHLNSITNKNCVYIPKCVFLSDLYTFSNWIENNSGSSNTYCEFNSTINMCECTTDAREGTYALLQIFDSIIYEPVIPDDVADDILHRLNTTYNNYTTDNSQETINKTIDILKNITNLVDNVANETYIDENDVINSFKLADGYLNVDKGIIDQSQKAQNTSLRMIDSLERIITKADNLDEPINLDNIKAALFKISKDQIIGISVSQNNSNISTLYGPLSDLTDTKEAVYLNTNSVLNTFQNNPNLKLGFIVYSKSSFFGLTSQQNTSTNNNGSCIQKSHSRSVITANSNIPLNKVENLVTLYFNDGQSNSTCNYKYTCVYWDFDLNNGTGDWSNDGCYYNTTSHTCVCNHMTNFAMLISLDDSIISGCDWCSEALLIVSVIGSCASIICLLVTIFIITLNEIQVHRRNDSSKFMGLLAYHNKMLITLCVSLLLMNVFYLLFAFIKSDTLNNQFCIAIGAFLHFFILFTFFIMFFMALLRYLMIYYVFTDIPHFNLIAIGSSFGLSALLVIICGLVPPNYPPDSWLKYITKDKSCWLHDLNVLFVLIPIAVVLVVNFALFFLIIKEIVGHKNNKLEKKYRTTTTVDRRKNSQVFRVIIVCFFTTGLTWLFAFLVITPVPPVGKFIFAFIFCILNAFQGVFILIACVLLKYFDKTSKRSKDTGPTHTSSDQSTNQTNETTASATSTNIDGGLVQRNSKFYNELFDMDEVTRANSVYITKEE